MKTPKITKSLPIGLFCVLVAAIGCESKFAESSADSVKIHGVSLEERLNQKDKVDSRIEEVERAADKAKKIIELFKKTNNPSENEETYTPVDFLLDVNVELKEKIPENRGDKLVRYGKIKLPITILSEECRNVDTMLVSSTLVDESTPEKKPIGERLTYTLKTCGSDGQYLDAITADWVGSTLELKLINKNLEKIFNNLLLTDALKDSSCRVSQGERKILDSISCENMDVRLSKTEVAKLEKLVFSNSSDTRFYVKANIFENARFKAVTEFTVFADGKTDFKATKVGEAPAPGVAPVPSTAAVTSPSDASTK